jgi:hypothetical protein
MKVLPNRFVSRRKRDGEPAITISITASFRRTISGAKGEGSS